MSLPTPNLDDRTFQDIVDEAKGRIARLCPEWTDHNVSDPGVTLIELFAWMVEMLLFRLNRVPEKSYITFMELMGVRLDPPAPARAQLSFYLTAPAAELQEIEAGVEVATRQTNSSEAPVVFSTDALLVIRPPGDCAYLTSSDNEATFQDHTEIPPEGFAVFSSPPKLEDDALYIVMHSDVSAHILALDLECVIEGSNIDSRDPPLAAEAWCGNGWRAAVIESDTTSGLNEPGRLVLRLPLDMTSRERAGYTGRWVRIVHRRLHSQQHTYERPPKIQGIATRTIGATVAATQAITITGEVLGRSDGTPGQQFALQYRPVLPFVDGERVEVEADPTNGERDATRWEPWLPPPAGHFGDSQGKRHALLDSASGRISFGPQIRQPNGEICQYGRIPPRGRQIRVSSYRSGGGAHGNVARDKITELRRTISYVRRVTNHEPATGGRDAERIEHAMLRAPQEIRGPARAVTASDYELLARQADPRVAHARCITPDPDGADGRPQPGTVRVVVIPTAQPDPDGQIPRDRLRLNDSLRAAVYRYLDQRRLLTTKLEIAEPEYVVVTVEAALKLRASASARQVQREAAAEICRFLNPPADGNGADWSFGRTLHVSEIYALLMGIPGVAYVQRARLLRDDGDGEDCIELGDQQLIVSGAHRIETE